MKSTMEMSEGMNETIITRRQRVMKSQWPIEIYLGCPPSYESHPGRNLVEWSLSYLFMDTCNMLPFLQDEIKWSRGSSVLKELGVSIKPLVPTLALSTLKSMCLLLNGS
jgi:hypothetical protein